MPASPLCQRKTRDLVLSGPNYPKKHKVDVHSRLPCYDNERRTFWMLRVGGQSSGVGEEDCGRVHVSDAWGLLTEFLFKPQL
jgi:hypothetical protein